MGLLTLLLRVALREPKPPTKEEGQALEDSFDRRERDPSFEQLAGKKCKHCKGNIVAQPEGQRCATCRKAIHRTCAESHLMKCGAPESPPKR